MAEIRLNRAALAFGDHVLLDNVDLSIQHGERLCVLGRNGEGKSTLLKVIAGQMQLDDGTVQYRDELKMAALQQELPVSTEGSVYDVVAEGLGNLGNVLTAYHEEILKGNDADLNLLERLQVEIENNDGWSWQQKVDSMLQRLKLPAEEMFNALSGGWKRRVMLARALVAEPDILILDEPTNHMDIPTIQWLEEQIKQFRGTILFISHDRAFVQSLSTRIVELDRGKLYNWDGDYLTFLEYKEKRLEDEENQRALFDKRLAQEEVWIRQGVKARRTRNEGRVERLKEMRNEHKARRNVQGNVNLAMAKTDNSGKIVFELDNMSYQYDQQDATSLIVKDFSSVVMRGDRIGLVGPNGVGKSTLINLLLEKIQPSEGTMKVGTKLEVAYFDQARAVLDLEKSVAENVGDGKDQVEVNGSHRHILGYLGDFLFDPQRARMPVKALSGGERNRVLLAKLFLKPCNLLIMDEPTNDLDVETLELLEEKLMEFKGTLLLVSHDRSFLDNVVTELWIFAGDGKIDEQIGGYSEWYERGGRLATERISENFLQPVGKGATPAPAPQVNNEPAKKKKKLSYKLQRELDELPKKIEKSEGKMQELQTLTGAADFYSKDASYVSEKLDEMEALQAQLDEMEGRWLELEELTE